MLGLDNHRVVLLIVLLLPRYSSVLAKKEDSRPVNPGTPQNESTVKKAALSELIRATPKVIVTSEEPQTGDSKKKDKMNSHSDMFKGLMELHPFAKWNKIMEEHEKIIATLQQVYGFRVDDETLEGCSDGYFKIQKEFVHKDNLFYKFCLHELSHENLNQFKDKEKMTGETMEQMESLLSICGGEFRLQMMELRPLFFKAFILSYQCLIERSRDTLDVLSMKNYFGLMVKSMELMSKELKYLLEQFGKIEGKFTKSEKDVMVSYKKRMESYRSELTGYLNHANKTRWMKIVHEFEDAVRNVPYMNEGTLKEMTKVDDYIQSRIFKKYIQISDQFLGVNKTDSATGLLYEILWVHRRFKTLVSDVSGKLQNFFDLLDITKKTKMSKILFTETSQTFGYQCVNSDFHPVGTCTYENHEICMESAANPYYISNFLPVKECQCGYNAECLDKYDDQDEGDWRCRLFPNSEGQCRGGLGYACSTFPLGPGQFDESCLSGNCNMTKNECDRILDSESQMSLKARGSMFKWAEIRHILG